MSQADSLALLKKFDRWLANEDRDSDGHVTLEDGRFRAGIGIYYFEEPIANQVDEERSP
jgi:hypothetical protein